MSLRNEATSKTVVVASLLGLTLTASACGGASSEATSEASTQTPQITQTTDEGATQPVVESTEGAAADPAVVRDAVQGADGTWVAGLPLSAAETVALATALADPAAYEGRVVRTTARIEQVCQTSGCWMIVVDGEQQARVTFADYGFFVPKHVAGATVEMDVRIERSVMDEATARHLASETEGEDPAAITGPVETISVVATGVRIVEPAE